MNGMSSGAHGVQIVRARGGGSCGLAAYPNASSRSPCVGDRPGTLQTPRAKPEGMLGRLDRGVSSEGKSKSEDVPTQNSNLNLKCNHPWNRSRTESSVLWSTTGFASAWRARAIPLYMGKNPRRPASRLWVRRSITQPPPPDARTIHNSQCARVMPFPSPHLPTTLF